MKTKTKWLLLFINLLFLFIFFAIGTYKEESYRKREDFFYLKISSVNIYPIKYEITEKAMKKIGDDYEAILNNKNKYIMVQLDKNKVANFIDLCTTNNNKENSYIFIKFKIFNSAVDIGLNDFDDFEMSKKKKIAYAKVIFINGKLRFLGWYDKNFKEI